MVDGKAYCFDHSKAILTARLKKAYESWVHGDAPVEDFSKLLGRVAQDFGWNLIDGNCLSYARIRDRAWNFGKTESGCRFEITRHPGAHRDGFVTRKTVQTWDVDLDEETLTLIDERDWVQGNPDPGYGTRRPASSPRAESCKKCHDLGQEG